jgi:hypothetical protein
VTNCSPASSPSTLNVSDVWPWNMSRPRQRRTAASLNEATGYVSKFKLVCTRPTISSRRSEFGGQAGMVQSGVGLGIAVWGVGDSFAFNRPGPPFAGTSPMASSKIPSPGHLIQTNALPALLKQSRDVKSLLDARGEHRMGWAHQGYGEFLAVTHECLVGRRSTKQRRRPCR